MKVKLTIELEINEEVFENSEEQKLWIEKEILVCDGRLILHSNEIGDTLGEIKKVSNIKWETSKKVLDVRKEKLKNEEKKLIAK